MTSIGLLVLLSCIICCTENEPPEATPAPAASEKLEGLPLEFTVKQRSTQTVPKSDEALTITIGDITRGQVAVSLLDKRGVPLFGPISMKADDTRSFELREVTYTLRLKQLANALVGDDFAFFVVDAKRPALTEDETIERLIADLAELEDAVFIRNGTEHDAEEAAAHLRTKLHSARDRIQSASDFIDLIASKSSLTGSEYKIRMSDGQIITAHEYFRGQLKQLDAPAEPQSRVSPR